MDENEKKNLPAPRKGGLLNHATIDELKSHVAIIGEVAKSVMVEGRHYGVIEGCGDKKVLLKPGAELLNVTFSLRPVYEIIATVEEESFLSYTTRCTLETIGEGHVVATGIGAANSRESKYRYRTEYLGEVPKEYWKNRDPSLLGGPDYKPKKRGGKWYIAHQVEYNNPWEYQNTLIKMSGKRSLIAAVLNAVAASDYFTQDLEDMPSDIIDVKVMDVEDDVPTDLFVSFCDRIQEAGDEDLPGIGKEVAQAHKDGKIGEGEYKDLTARGKARRKELDGEKKSAKA